MSRKPNCFGVKLEKYDVLLGWEHLKGILLRSYYETKEEDD